MSFGTNTHRHPVNFLITVHRSSSQCRCMRAPYLRYTLSKYRHGMTWTAVHHSKVSRNPLLSCLAETRVLCCNRRTSWEDSNVDSTEEENEPLTDSWLLEPVQITPYNTISVVQIGPSANHEFAGCTVLKLDDTNNIHSIRYPSSYHQPRHVFACDPKSGYGRSRLDADTLDVSGPDAAFPNAVWTNCYYDEFASLPPILPPGPVAIFGLGAGSAARVLLHSWPSLRIEGWEIDDQVIRVARKYFGLLELERFHTGSRKNGKLVGRTRGGVRSRRSRHEKENVGLEKSVQSNSLHQETHYQCTGELTVQIGDVFRAGFWESTTGEESGARDLVQKRGEWCELGRSGEKGRLASAGNGDNTVIQTQEFGCNEIGRYAGIIVDVFSCGKPNVELREAATWQRIVSKLLPGGRVMINCGSPAAAEIPDEGDVSGDVSSDVSSDVSRSVMSEVDDLDEDAPEWNNEFSGDSWQGRADSDRTGETGGCDCGVVDADVAAGGRDGLGKKMEARGRRCHESEGVDRDVGRMASGGLDNFEYDERERHMGVGDGRDVGMNADGIIGRSESEKVGVEAVLSGMEGVGGDRKVRSGKSDGKKLGGDRWQKETDAIIRAVKCVVGGEVYGKYTRDSGGNFLVLTGQVCKEEWARTMPTFLASGVQDWMKL